MRLMVVHGPWFQEFVIGGIEQTWRAGPTFVEFCSMACSSAVSPMELLTLPPPPPPPPPSTLWAADAWNTISNQRYKQATKNGCAMQFWKRCIAHEEHAHVPPMLE